MTNKGEKQLLVTLHASLSAVKEVPGHNVLFEKFYYGPWICERFSLTSCMWCSQVSLWVMSSVSLELTNTASSYFWCKNVNKLRKARVKRFVCLGSVLPRYYSMQVKLCPTAKLIAGTVCTTLPVVCTRALSRSSIAQQTLIPLLSGGSCYSNIPYTVWFILSHRGKLVSHSLPALTSLSTRFIQ